MKAPSSKVLLMLGLASFVMSAMFEPVARRVPAIDANGGPATRIHLDSAEMIPFVISCLIFAVCAILLLVRCFRLVYERRSSKKPEV
jgi:hypothetical protein